MGKESNSLGGLTSLRNTFRSGRDNLPLHVFRLQQMALVRHHPRYRGTETRTKRQREPAEFDLRLIQA